jgi:site-specific DNA recombinase
MKAFLIARVSNEDQEDALPGQVYRLENYAVRNDYTHELFQFQESAFKEGRKLFGDIVEQIELHPEKSAVIFDKIDRYSRDSGSVETRKLRRLCLDGKIEIHFASDNLVLDNKSSANSWFMLGMGEATAEYYSRSISDNVRRRFEQKRRDGEWIGRAPFGYVNVDLDNTKKWVNTHPLQSLAVKSAFEWYATGNYSLWLIRNKLIDECSFILSKSQLERMFKNPFYKGEMLIQGKQYPHKYNRIVSEELFEQVQAVREGRFKKPTRYAGLPYPYRGLIKCSECNCLVTFEKKKSKYIYGHCTQYKGKHGAQYIEQYKFTNQLKTAIESFEMPQEDYEEIRSKVLESFKIDDKTNIDKLAHINTEIKKYEKRLDKLYEDHSDGLVPDDFYQRKFVEYTQLKKNLEKQKRTFELSDNSRFETIDYLLKLFRDAPKIFEKADIEHKRSIMNLALSNLELNDDLLRWKLKEPFDTAALCKENNNWLGMRDSNPRSWNQNPLPYHLANPH